MCKVKLERIDTETLRMAIRKAYEDDAEMRDIHVLRGASLGEMVDYTWRQSTEHPEMGVKLYKVTLDHTMIGYTTLLLEPVKILFTFGINIHYRKRDILLAWLKSVDLHLGLEYHLSLRDSNVRAVEFFERNGFGSVHIPEENKYALWRHRQL